MSKTVNQIFFTGLNGITVIAGIVILNGLIARLYGIDSLGEYLLIRRIASALIPLSLFGVAIGIPRYVGIAKEYPKEQMRIITAGVQLFLSYGLPIVLVVGLFFVIFPSILGQDTSITDTVIPLVVLSVALALHQISYSFYRGKSMMRWANLLQLINVGLIPLSIVWFTNIKYVGELVLWHGLITMGITVIVIAKPVITVCSSNTSVKLLRDVRRKLLNYSFRRIGAVLGMVALLTVGPLLMVRFASKEDLAFFSIGLQINRMFFFLFGPIGIVLLSRFAYLVSKGKIKEVNKGLSMIFQASTAIGLYASIHLWYFAEPLLELWLGNVSPGGILIFRVFVLSIPFYLWFENARNPIDAYSEKGYNSRNLILSILAMGISLVVMKIVLNMSFPFSITISYVMSFAVLGIMSIYTCQKLYGFRWGGLHLSAEIIILNLLIVGLMEFLIRYLNLTRYSLISLFSIELFMFSIYILSILVLKHEWLFYLLKYIGLLKFINLDSRGRNID